LFATLQLRPDFRIEQAGKISVIAFPIVLIAEEVVARFSGILD
jgi:hypothetical protein